MAIPKKAPTKRVVKSGTRVSYEKTVIEIQQHLVKAGAKKITFDYDEAELPCAITFSYPHKNGLMFFSLPVRFNGMEKIMRQQGGWTRGGEMQPINTGWRIMKDWILAQLALVQAEIAELPEIFLPYAVMPNGETMWENIKTSNEPPFKLLT